MKADCSVAGQQSSSGTIGGAWRSSRVIAESVAASALRESASQSVVRVRCEQTLVVLVTHAKRRATWIDPAGIIGLFVMVPEIPAVDVPFTQPTERLVERGQRVQLWISRPNRAMCRRNGCVEFEHSKDVQAASPLIEPAISEVICNDLRMFQDSQTVVS
ncbi:MAG: hypothetical protein ACI92S_001552 [Planctomycetaceae bacterium]